MIFDNNSYNTNGIGYWKPYLRYTYVKYVVCHFTSLLYRARSFASQIVLVGSGSDVLNLTEKLDWYSFTVSTF